MKEQKHMTEQERQELEIMLARCLTDLGLAAQEAAEYEPLVYGCCGYCDWGKYCDKPEGGAGTGCRPEGAGAYLCRAVIRILRYLEGKEIDAAGLMQMITAFDAAYDEEAEL